MDWDTCCSQQVLIWRTRPAGRRFADQYVCANCEQIHRSEQWYAPLAWSGANDCLNCGAPHQVSSDCSRCHSSPAKSAALHRKLIKLHPEQDPLKGAQMAFQQGRNVLALKLATAALLHEATQTEAKLIRLRVMERIGFIAPALDQAWKWVDEGAPQDVWAMIAHLEAAQGNLDGALFALERGVQAAPDSKMLWIDYAELLAHKDNRPLAIRAASNAQHSPSARDRALNVIGNMANRYYKDGLMADAVKALHMAGTSQDENLTITWLRAQIADATKQPADCHKWLNVVLSLSPNHEGALALKAKGDTVPAAPMRQASPTSQKQEADVDSSKRRWWSARA